MSNREIPKEFIERGINRKFKLVLERCIDSNTKLFSQIEQIVIDYNNGLARKILYTHCYNNREIDLHAPTVIWGDDGPVEYSDINEHPKVKARKKRLRKQHMTMKKLEKMK